MAACLPSSPDEPDDAARPDAPEDARDAAVDAEFDGGESGDDGTADVGPDREDAAADDGDACRPRHCDCWCWSSGAMAGPCCDGGRLGRIEYRYPIGPDGCPGCTCGFHPERECAEGCVAFGPDRLPACREDLRAWCGNGWVEEWEGCDPAIPWPCDIPDCVVHGRRPCDEYCRVDRTRCEPAPEDCGNGADDDCDGETDAADPDCPRACE